MKWSPEELKPGDMIRAKVGSVYHYGIFVSEDEVIAFGYPPVNLAAVRDEEVRVVSTDIDTFAAGAFVERGVMDGAESRKARSSEEIIRSARERLGEGGYSLLHNNCEHFANECVFGVKKSAQEDKARERWNKRPQFSVFVTEIPEDLEPQKVYPPQRSREQFFSKNTAVRRQRYAVWKLLETAVDRSFGYDFNRLNFKKSRDGKWTADGFEFSLSHTDGAAAVVVSNEACGVDIENIREREHYYASSPEKLQRLMKRIMTEKEADGQCEKTPSVMDFLVLWTRKESIFKAYDAKRFIPDQVETSDYPVKTFRIQPLPDFLISGSGTQCPLLSVYLVKDGKCRKITAEEILPAEEAGA